MIEEIELLEPEVDKEVEHAIDELINPTKAIILYNDDHNTFPHVIECLRRYCGHSMEQAEQCTIIIHHNGKCDVKHGSFEKLKPVCEALLENGLTARIE
jgi:ATP-dependent Clp protease adaptor protein ClpS